MNTGKKTLYIIFYNNRREYVKAVYKMDKIAQTRKYYNTGVKDKRLNTDRWEYCNMLYLLEDMYLYNYYNTNIPNTLDAGWENYNIKILKVNTNIKLYKHILL